MSSRDLTAGMLTAIAAGTVRPAIFYEGQFADQGSPPVAEMLRLFTGIGTIDWNGYTWTGGSDLLSFSPIKEAADVQAVGFAVTMSGLPSDKIDLALSRIRQGLPGKLWLGLFNNLSTVTTTFDPAAKSTHIALSNSNLTATSDGQNISGLVKSTLFKSEGQLYCEFTIATAGASPEVGLANAAADVDGTNVYLGKDLNSYGYASNGQKAHSSGLTAYAAVWTTGDIISMLVDFDAGTLSFWVNGSDQGVAYSGVAGSFGPAAQTYGTAVITANYGGSAFTYTPPAGYVGWTITPADTLIADPYMLRRGKFDIAVIDRSGDSCTIQAQYEDRLIDLERPRARRYTSADQQRDYPADLGFDYVPSLQDMQILWR